MPRIIEFANIYKIKSYQIFSIQERSSLNNWGFQETLYEALIEWFESNPEYKSKIKKECKK